MPFDASLLPWWGWLLCSAGAAVAAMISFAFSARHWLFGLAGLIFTIGSALLGLTGLILFAEWVWNN